MDPIKALGHDGVSVRMIRISCRSIIKLLVIIFRNYLKFGTFLDDWRKGNVVLVYKKNNKQIVDNYRPASLLSIYSKNFEKLVFNAIFETYDRKKPSK